MTIAAAEATSVTAIRSFIGTRRRRQWYDWYAIGFAVVLAAILGSDVFAEPFSRLTTSSGSPGGGRCRAGGCGAAGLLVVAQTFGPLAVSPPDASWLLPPRWTGARCSGAR